MIARVKMQMNMAISQFHNYRREKMYELYKEHFIRSGAAPVPGTSEWKPTIQVYWTEGGKGCVKAWMASRFNQGFATERLAEVEGILFAREWIDDGKPNLEP